MNMVIAFILGIGVQYLLVFVIAKRKLNIMTRSANNFIRLFFVAGAFSLKLEFCWILLYFFIWIHNESLGTEVAQFPMITALVLASPFAMAFHFYLLEIMLLVNRPKKENDALIVSENNEPRKTNTDEPFPGWRES